MLKNKFIFFIPKRFEMENGVWYLNTIKRIPTKIIDDNLFKFISRKMTEDEMKDLRLPMVTRIPGLKTLMNMEFPNNLYKEIEESFKEYDILVFELNKSNEDFPDKFYRKGYNVIVFEPSHHYYRMVVESLKRSKLSYEWLQRYEWNIRESIGLFVPGYLLYRAKNLDSFSNIISGVNLNRRFSQYINEEYNRKNE